MNGQGRIQDGTVLAGPVVAPRLLWVGTGVETIVLDNQIHTITPDLGLWLPAGVAEVSAGNCGVVDFNPVVSPQLAEHPVPVKIAQLVRLLLGRLTDPAVGPGSRQLTAAMVADLLCPTESPILVTLPTAPLLDPVVRALREEPGHPFSLEQWAGELGVCGKTVTRAFHAETGLSFTRWRAVLRARAAVVLLSEGQDPAAVARRTGYHSTSAFGAAFRRVTGMTPGQFRPEP